MWRITQDDENMLPKGRNVLRLRQKQKGELYMAEYFVCGKNDPIVQTKQGKIRGYRLNTTFTFHGIPYAQAKRFQSPEPVTPWEGIRDALAFGYVCPLLHQDAPGNELLVRHRYWPQDENCQNLNIWTQSLDPKAKKPVMVWLHGGGFSSGSAIEHVAYEGDHLSEYGDVVAVSVNHRLNILGYLDLSPFGEKYKNSANAGNEDLVAALVWIHENIEAFGGDPDNVTIFGQSGGGMKVVTLMNTPAAAGLFHKGIIESGVYNAGVYQKEDGDGTQIVTAMLQALGKTADDVEVLETIPYYELANAYNQVAEQVKSQGYYTGLAPMQNDWFAGNPLKTGFIRTAESIPVLAGTVIGEFDFGAVVNRKHELTKQEALAFLRRKYGEHTENLLELFRKAYPEKCEADLWSVDTVFRTPTIALLREKAKLSAPVYSYQLTYEFPIDGGKAAWHCSEIPFVFHNTDRVPVCNVQGETDRLQERMCSAWVNFARYGSPQTASLPKWSPCRPDDEATMIFDNVCEVRHNFDHALQARLTEIEYPLFLPVEDENEERLQIH